MNQVLRIIQLSTLATLTACATTEPSPSRVEPPTLAPDPVSCPVPQPVTCPDLGTCPDPVACPDVTCPDPRPVPPHWIAVGPVNPAEAHHCSLMHAVMVGGSTVDWYETFVPGDEIILPSPWEMIESVTCFDPGQGVEWITVRVEWPLTL